MATVQLLELPILIPIPILGPLPRLAYSHVPATSTNKKKQNQDGRCHVRSPQSAARTARSPQHLPAVYVLGSVHVHTARGSTALNSCHGDQALIPSEYSDDDVESFGPGGEGYGAYDPVPVPVPGRAGPPPASPSYPSASSRPSPRFLDLRLKCG